MRAQCVLTGGKKADHPVRAETDIVNATPECEAQAPPPVTRREVWAPIASVSLESPAVLRGGKWRSDPVRRRHLESGDIAVWGGPARFVYHGVQPLKGRPHPLTRIARINLAFRKHGTLSAG